MERGGGVMGLWYIMWYEVADSESGLAWWDRWVWCGETEQGVDGRGGQTARLDTTAQTWLLLLDCRQASADYRHAGSGCRHAGADYRHAGADYRHTGADYRHTGADYRSY